MKILLYIDYCFHFGFAIFKLIVFLDDPKVDSIVFIALNKSTTCLH